MPSETCYLNEGQKVSELFPAFFMASQLCQKAGKNELSLSWKISGFFLSAAPSNEISVIWAKNTISTKEINNKKELHYVWLRFVLFGNLFEEIGIKENLICFQSKKSWRQFEKFKFIFFLIFIACYKKCYPYFLQSCASSLYSW